MAKEFSIIIVSYNCRAELKACLDSVKAHIDERSETIVVDNGSSDGSAEYLAGLNGVTVVQNPANEGFARACNTGAARASGEYLVFLNPDTLVTNGWLDRMRLHFRNPEVGAVGPVSTYVAGLQKYEIHTRERWNSSVNLPSFAEALYLENTGRGLETKLLIGFCLMIRTELFHLLKGMDETLFLGNDDLDLCWRLRNMGHKLAVATDTFIFHHGQKSFQSEPNSVVSRLVQESTDALYEKLVNHYGGPESVPAPEEMWGINWFKPSKQAISRWSQNMKPVSATTGNYGPAWIVYVPPDLNDQGPVLSTLASIPDTEAARVLLLNHNTHLNLTPSGFKGTRLDVPVEKSLKSVLEMGLNLIQEEKLLFLFSGVEISGFFALRLGELTRDNKIDAVGIPLALAQLPGESQALSPGCRAFFCQVAWFKKFLKESKESELLDELNNVVGQLPQVQPPLPVLRFSGSQTGEMGKNVAFEQKQFNQYPESLRYHMVQHQNIGFFEEGAEPAYSPEGNTVEPEACDLLIMRAGLKFPQDIKKLRESSNALKKLILLSLPEAEKQNQAPSADEAFGLNGLRASLWNAGYSVDETEIYSGIPGSPATEAPKPARKRASLKEGEECKGFQIVGRPRLEGYALEKSVSIIILGFNQVDYSRHCIESIRNHTRQKYELILVDNGSRDDTASYFQSIPGAKVIVNQKNLGVAMGWNQGMKAASGDYLLVLNNDTLVFPGWLENMVRLAESSPALGLIGPRSNNISGPQHIENTQLSNMAQIQAFAQKWQEDHNLSAFESERLVGFCMLISREAFEKIGTFDERFGKGNFEDDDYCLRAKYHGYQLAVADDSFVFHFGSKSFADSSVNWHALMKENENKFIEKWHKGAAAINDVAMKEKKELPSVQAILRQATQAYDKQELDEALRLYLQAAEIDDSIPEVLNGLGIIAFHKEQYTEALGLFRKALERNPKDEDIARNIVDVLNASCSTEEASKCFNALLVDFADNSVFLKELEKITGTSKSAPQHWRTHVEELIQKKRYNEALDILEKWLHAGIELAFCYNYLGIIAFECGDAEMAWQHFQKSLEMNLLDEDVLINYHDAGITLGKHSEVLAILEKVFSYPGKSSEFQEIKQCYDQLKIQARDGSWNPDMIILSRENNIAGENLIREGLADKAQKVFEEILQEDPRNFRAYNNLGLLAWYREDTQSAWACFTKSLGYNPIYTDALINAFDAALKLKKIEDFRAYLDNTLKMEPHNRDAQDLIRLIMEKGSKIYDVQCYESIDPVNSKFAEAQAFLKQNKLNDATLSYLEVIEKKPDWFAPYNALGCIAFKRKMYRESFKLFERAVELNPLDEVSLMNLWENAEMLGMEKEIADRLVSAVQIDPGLQQVKSVVDSLKLD